MLAGEEVVASERTVGRVREDNDREAKGGMPCEEEAGAEKVRPVGVDTVLERARGKEDCGGETLEELAKAAGPTLCETDRCLEEDWARGGDTRE